MNSLYANYLLGKGGKLAGYLMWLWSSDDKSFQFAN